MMFAKIIGRNLGVAGIAVLAALAAGAGAGEDGERQMMPNRNPALEAIHARRSVRTFSDKPVTREQLTALLQAAMAAPSGRDLRPWLFVVIDDRATLDRLADGLPNASMLRTAQAAVAVCGDLERNGVDGTDYWVVDCALASQNLLLGAESLGLGAVYTAAWPYAGRTEHIIKTLGLPGTVRPLCVIPLGHPAGDEKPKDKWDPANIHWNEWKPAAAVSEEAASDSAAAASVKAPAPEDLLHRRFTLAKVDGEDFSVEEPAQRPDIEFNEGFQIIGRVCNRFRGPARLEGGKLIAENLAASRMHCIQPELNDLEQLFFAMLSAGADIVLSENGELTLSGNGRELLYARADWAR